MSSWFKGIAERTESLLNNLDQSAADALSKTESPTSSSQAFYSHRAQLASQQHARNSSYSPGYSLTDVGEDPRTKQSSAPSSVVMGNQSRPPRMLTSSSSESKLKSNKEEELLEFLNSGNLDNSSENTISIKSSSNHSPRTKVSAQKNSEIQTSAVNSLIDKNYVSYEHGADSQAPNQESSEVSGYSSTSYASANPPGPSESNDYPLSPDCDPRVENKILRSEVNSLSLEVSSLLQRNHKAEEESKRLRAEVDKLHGQLRESDKRFREVRGQCDDLQERIHVKESQITALNSELSAHSLNNERLQTELTLAAQQKSEVLTDHSSTKEAQHFIQEELRNNLKRIESELAKEREVLHQVRNENDQLHRDLEEAKLRESEYSRKLEQVQREEKRKQDAITSQLELSRQRHDSLQRELKDYKEKATKILQMKEKLISSLKGESVSYVQSGDSSVSTSDVEMSSLREENKILREEIARCRLDLERTQCDSEDIEREMASQRESLRRNIDLLEEELEREKQVRQDSEQELAQLRRECQMLHERSVRQRNELSEQTNQREEELTRLRNMLTLKSSQSESQQELEARVRSLTENLIQKQTIVDTLKSEKHSLQVQLERLEQDYQSLEQSHITLAANSDYATRNSMSGYTGGLSERGSGSQALINRSATQEEFLRINIQDPPLTKNVKAAVNTLDKFSIRLGVFFRRYPPARLFLIGYTFLLHIWVFFVLVTYQPEIHQSLMSAASANSQSNLADSAPNSLSNAKHPPLEGLAPKPPPIKNS